MKRALGVALVALVMAGMATAAPQSNDQPFPKTLINVRYVYVTSYDGDQFSMGLLQEDRQAIASVQDAIQKWGKYVVVYRPQDADIVLMVQSRPSEDVLAVYDAKLWPQTNYLWRAMGTDGLQSGETPLVTRLEKAVEKASK